MLPVAPRTLLLACVAAMALFALPAPAQAAPYMVSVMQDDNQLVYGNGAQLRNALDRMRGLGVEAVRATMLWKAIAPKNTARRKPRGFNGAKPGDVPADRVGSLRRARGRGARARDQRELQPDRRGPAVGPQEDAA